jgi:lipoate-protein ligase B
MDLLVCHLGQVEYREAAALQERLREQVIAGELPELMLLLEHPPVYTIGRRSDAGDLPFPEAFYRERGIDVVRTPRGGQLTYHGPGQLVGYPIMRVASVPEYILTMERALVAALADAGLEAGTKLGHKHVGVWVGERKIASVGVHISHGVSAHGFAVNVENDMDPWSWVVACGLPEVQMTSLRAEGIAEGLHCFRKRAAFRFCEAFGRRQRLISPARLGIEAPVWTSV